MADKRHYRIALRLMSEKVLYNTQPKIRSNQSNRSIYCTYQAICDLRNKLISKYSSKL